MLVIEDFSESNRIQMVLKKIGFDVLSVQKATGLADKVLGFNPDVIVSYGTQKFTGITVGQKLIEMRHSKAKSVIVLHKGERPNQTELSQIRMDVIMEAPIIPEKLIEIISRLTGLEAGPILEKLKKAQLTDPILAAFKAAAAHEASAPKQDPFTDTARADKYKKLVEKLPVFDKMQTTFVKSELKAHQEEMEKSWDPQLTESINELKKQFVEAMFKKGE